MLTINGDSIHYPASGFLEVGFPGYPLPLDRQDLHFSASLAHGRAEAFPKFLQLHSLECETLQLMEKVARDFIEIRGLWFRF